MSNLVDVLIPDDDVNIAIVLNNNFYESQHHSLM